MKQYKWQDKQPHFQREIEYLEGIGDKDPEIDSVLIIAPQRKTSTVTSVWRCGDEKLSVWSRTRIEKRRFSAISGSVDRAIADYFANVSHTVESLSQETENLKAPRSAVMLVYPLLPTGDSLLKEDEVSDQNISIGLGIGFPNNNIQTAILTSSFYSMNSLN